MMKKPWSVTTTVRNPDRLRDFLAVLQKLENSEWNHENQKKYQILLIQNRLYGYGKQQFYNGLTDEQIKLIDDSSKEIPFEQAAEIFDEKNYEDPPMRGRQSLNPLKKFGFAAIKNGKIFITDLGKLFLQGDFKDNLGEIFLKSFLKWQLPNPDSRRDYPENTYYDVKPFVATLHLINKVNQKEIACGNEPKGISKQEFSLFAPTLVHYEDIDCYAEKIVDLRRKGTTKKGVVPESYKKQFAEKFLETHNPEETDKFLNNLKDYGDNAIRYFRLIPYVYIRGGGFYVDLEPRRKIEIESLLDHNNAQAKDFESKEEYFAYMSDVSRPQLPWETLEKRIEIIKELVKEIQQYETDLQIENIEISDYLKMRNNELGDYITELRSYRQTLLEEKNRRKSQSVEQIESYIEDLKNIHHSEDDRPILLEKLATLGLHALDDALEIKPNYPVGDDNEPTFTAPANVPDIECFYKSFNAICEVTMLTGRNQWYYEGQPVMRHLRDFEDDHKDKPSYCVFIAPKLHRDTINTFWNAVKYEYEGQQQKIIPLSISNFVFILKALLHLKTEQKILRHENISYLYDQILASTDSFSDSNEWLRSIRATISSWRKDLFS